jgi:hypothetical protein
MYLSIPLLVLAGIGIYLGWRFTGLRIWQITLCVLFGFLLAATSAAPEINNFLNSLVHWATKP